MNVKQGDLAIVLKSRAGNEGKIVSVGVMLGSSPLFGGFIWYEGEGQCWLVRFERPAPSERGNFYIDMPIPDSRLRPVSGLPDTKDADIEQPIKEVA